MPGGDTTGPRGTFVGCVDPRTGLRRPLMRFSRPAYGRGLGRGMGRGRMGRGRGRRGRW